MFSKRNNILISCSLLFLFWGINNAHAATLQFDSNPVSIKVGGTATLYVSVDSEGVSINNAESNIKFSNDLVDIVSINKYDSVFSLWVEEPSFSNSTGLISFNGGVPNPGFNGTQGSVISIQIRAKKSGEANFSFTNSAVRANDGLGTDVLSGVKGKTIYISNSETPKPTETPADTKNAIYISSTSHPDQDSWYKDNSPIFKWTLPNGVDSIQTSISTNTSVVPNVTYTPAISEKAVTDLNDGIWYFKARAHKGNSWGPTDTYIVRIDTTPPQKNDVNFSYDQDKKILNISENFTDSGSGIDRFEVYINDVLIKTISINDINSNKFGVPYDAIGDNRIKLSVFDHAQNRTDTLGAFHSDAVSIKSESNFGNNTSLPITNSLIIFIISLIILLMIASYKLGEHHAKHNTKDIIRSGDVKIDNAKILNVLRRRLEKHLELLQNIRHTRILTKEEKDIKQSLESDLDEVDEAIAEL